MLEKQQPAEGPCPTASHRTAPPTPAYAYERLMRTPDKHKAIVARTLYALGWISRATLFHHTRAVTLAALSAEQLSQPAAEWQRQRQQQQRLLGAVA